MELDELKRSWNLLNEKMDQSTELNKRLLMELLHNRVRTQKEKLFNYEFINLLVCFGLIPIQLLLKKLMPPNMFILVMSLCLFATAWQCFKLWLCKGLDPLQSDTAELTGNAIRFQLITRNYFRIAIFLVIPIFLGLFAYFSYGIVPMWRIVVGGCIGLTIGILLELKHQNNIKDFLTALKDLKGNAE